MEKIHELINQFNDISRIIASTVVGEPKVADRAILLSNFIKIAQVKIILFIYF